MNAEVLLSGYTENTQELVFRVYSTELSAEERCKSHALEHLTAHDLLGAALLQDFGLRHVKITRRGLEKPVLLHENLHMNLSHCKGLAVAAVGRFPLGVDCERPRAVKDRLLDKICAESEAAAIRAQTDKNFAFARFWTLKEAYGKYTGEGIRAPLRALRFSLSEDGIRPFFPGAEELLFFQMILQDQHIISLCLPKHPLRVESAYRILSCAAADRSDCS